MNINSLMINHFVSIYGVRGGTKIYKVWHKWHKAPISVVSAPIRVIGKQWVVITTSPTEFIVGVNS